MAGNATLADLLITLDQRAGRSFHRDAKISYLQEALDWISAEDDWPWLFGTTTIPTVANQRNYTLPTDLGDLYGVIVDGTEYKPNSHRDLRRDIPAYSPSYALEGGNLVIEPTPTAAGLNIVVTYKKVEARLVNDNDSPLIPESWRFVLIEAALANMLERGGATERRRQNDADKVDRLIGRMRSGAMRQRRGPFLARVRW